MKRHRLIFVGIILIFLSNVSLGQPTIITLPPDSVSPTSAYLHAMCYPNGEKIGVRFNISKKVGGGGYSTSYQDIDSSVNFKEISVLVTGLMQNTNYYCGTFALTNNYDYVFGNDVAFATPVDTDAKGFAIPLYFQDSYGFYLRPLKFGVHTYATFCMDWQLDEFELPPLPLAGLADYRFVDPRSDPNSCMGLGLEQDLRHYLDLTQVDTFKVHLQPQNGAYPVIVLWPNLNNYFKGSVRLLDLFGGIIVNIDMKAQTSDTISAQLTDLLIIAEGPMNLISASFEYDYRESNSVIVTGSFNPGGLSTDGWFEWGPTNNYGNNTSKTYIGNGSDISRFHDSITNLPADSVYHYRAVVSNANGIIYGIDQSFEVPTSPTGVVNFPATPTNYRLYQNYPNPMNPATTIRYDLPKSALVTLKVYNIVGQEIATLVNDKRITGSYQAQFNGSALSSGIYFYRIVAGEFVQTKKLLLLK